MKETRKGNSLITRSSRTGGPVDRGGPLAVTRHLDFQQPNTVWRFNPLNRFLGCKTPSGQIPQLPHDGSSWLRHNGPIECPFKTKGSRRRTELKGYFVHSDNRK